MTSSFERQLTELRERLEALEAKLEEQAQHIEALERVVGKASAPDASATKARPSAVQSESRTDVPSAILDV